MLLVGIRYCGGCNPQIDRSGVITKLKDAIEKRGMAVDFTAERERSVNIVLLVNVPDSSLSREKWLTVTM